MELDADAAPATVTNFVKLAKEGFYDGRRFTVWPQGLCCRRRPKGNGTGGSAKPLPGEFSENGFDNPLTHTPGRHFHGPLTGL